MLNETTGAALIAFLWYRKGRLWKFYDSLLSTSIKQITTDSIDGDKWGKIAIKYSTLLQGMFNSLFQFEINYLKSKIQYLKVQLWIPDSETMKEKGFSVTVDYIDKEKYCIYTFEKELLPEFRFCGLFLFVNSIKYHLCREKCKDTGHTVTKHPVE